MDNKNKPYIVWVYDTHDKWLATYCKDEQEVLAAIGNSNGIEYIVTQRMYVNTFLSPIQS